MFFIFLTVALFLGDGKQSFVELFLALGVVGIAAIFRLNEHRFHLPPKKVFFLWMSVLIYFFLRIPFSVSVSQSLSATLRLVLGFVVYFMFYSLSAKGSVFVFLRLLIWFVGFAAVCSFVLLLFPFLSMGIPQMNLLYASHGHNYLAGLLLFVFPIVFWEAKKLRGVLRTAVLVLFFAGITLTVSRGAWMISILYVMVNMFGEKTIPPARKRTSAVLLGFPLFVSVVFLFYPSLFPFDGFVRLWGGEKQSVFTDGRLEYWKQSFAAFRKNPWFGSGPGTFYMQSKLFQRTPLLFSWFAHSFPLQSLVELGLVGAAPLFIIILTHFWPLAVSNTRKKLAKEGVELLLQGSLLTFVYSVFEFTLEFLVVWLLFWASLGIVFGMTKNKVDSRARGALMVNMVARALIFVVFVYYMVLVVGSTLAIWYPKTSFVIGLFRPQEAIRFFSYAQTAGINYKDNRVRLLRMFHLRDPEVTFAAALFTKQLNADRADELFAEAVALDPYNVDYLKTYVEFLFTRKNYDGIARAVRRSSQKLLTPSQQKSLQGVPVIPFTEDFRKDAKSDTTQDIREYLAKRLYLWGLGLINTDVLQTSVLWETAKSIAPWWGYLHVESASIVYHRFKKPEEAKQLLIDCQQDIYSATLCRVTMEDLSHIPIPGSFSNNIREIPNVLE